MLNIKNNVKTSGRGFKGILFFLIGIILALIYIFPIYILGSSSFKTQKGLFENPLSLPNKLNFTLNNYKSAFSRLNYFQSFLNSLYITIISVVLIVLISAMAAWALVRYKTKISKIIFLTFAISMLIPFQCTMLPLLKVARYVNLLNPQGLIFMYVGYGVSLSVVIIHGFIKNIPEEIEEAAIVDGCNVFQLFFMIVLPLLKIILITVAIINIMWIWNDFLLPSLIINNKPQWRTLPLMTFSFFGSYSRRWDLATAALFMCILPVILFYMWSQKYIISGITDGSIK